MDVLSRWSLSWPEDGLGKVPYGKLYHDHFSNARDKGTQQVLNRHLSVELTEVKGGCGQ